MDNSTYTAFLRLNQAILQGKALVNHIEMIRSQIFGDEVAHAHIWVWPNDTLGDPKDFEGNTEDN